MAMASFPLRRAIRVLASSLVGHSHDSAKLYCTTALLMESDGEAMAMATASSSSSSSFSPLSYRGFRPRLSHYEARKVCLLVRHSRWDAKLEAALSEVFLQSRLTPEDVAEVLAALPEAKQALRFFLWIRDSNPKLLGPASATVLSRRWSHERRFPDFLNSVDRLRASPEAAETFQGLMLGFFWAGLGHHAIATLARMEENLGFRLSAADFSFLILHLADAKMPAQAWETYQKMLRAGFCPDKKTLLSIMQCLLSDAEYAGKAYEVFQTMQKTGISVDTSVYTALIQTLCKSGQPTEAMEVFSKMMDTGLTIDSTFQNSLLTNIAMELLRASRVEEAYDIVKGIHEKGSSAGLVLLDSLFHSLCDSRKLDEAIWLWKSIGKDSTPVGSFLPRLLAELCRAEKFLESHWILQDLQGSHSSVDAHLYEILFRGLISNGHCQEAEELLSRLIQEDSVTDLRDLFLKLLLQNETSFCHATFHLLIRSFCNVGDLAVSQTLLNHMRKSGFKPGSTLINLLISTFCQHDRVEEGREILLQILEDEEACCKPDIATYDLVINGLAKLKAKKELELKLEMECQNASSIACNG